MLCQSLRQEHHAQYCQDNEEKAFQATTQHVYRLLPFPSGKGFAFGKIYESSVPLSACPAKIGSF